jgi:hypothetical protein
MIENIYNEKDEKVNLLNYLEAINFKTIIFLSSGECKIEIEMIEKYDKIENVILCDINYTKERKEEIRKMIKRKVNVYIENDNIFCLKYLTNPEKYKNPLIISFGYVLGNKYLTEEKDIYNQILKKIYYKYDMKKMIITSLKNNLENELIEGLYKKTEIKTEYDIFENIIYYFFKEKYFEDIIFKMKTILCPCYEIVKKKDVKSIFSIYN